MAILVFAKNLLMSPILLGCDAVKFQKRTVDKVYEKSSLFLRALGELPRFKEALEFAMNIRVGCLL